MRITLTWTRKASSAQQFKDGLAMDRYTPPVFDNGPMFLNNINQKIDDIKINNDRILQIMNSIDWCYFKKKDYIVS